MTKKTKILIGVIITVIIIAIGGLWFGKLSCDKKCKTLFYQSGRCGHIPQIGTSEYCKESEVGIGMTPDCRGDKTDNWGCCCIRK